tara:strand:- start:2469 stop:2684 length:216 start_codon:yes stop_codon:yes gene_type:complete
MEQDKKVEFTPTELAYLLDVIEQEKEELESIYWSDEECEENGDKLHKEILQDLYSKLVILNEKGLAWVKPK